MSDANASDCLHDIIEGLISNNKYLQALLLFIALRKKQRHF
jgi:hypothetical protein